MGKTAISPASCSLPSDLYIEGVYAGPKSVVLYMTQEQAEMLGAQSFAVAKDKKAKGMIRITGYYENNRLTTTRANKPSKKSRKK